MSISSIPVIRCRCVQRHLKRTTLVASSILIEVYGADRVHGLLTDCTGPEIFEQLVTSRLRIVDSVEDYHHAHLPRLHAIVVSEGEGTVFIMCTLRTGTNGKRTTEPL